MNTRLAEDGRPVLITGGAGFIGINVAARLLREGQRVIIYDNLSRAGAERNLRWLRDSHGDQLRLIEGDVQDEARLAAAAACSSRVFHFAAQVAETPRPSEPLAEYATNVRGTLHVLEALRRIGRRIPLLFTSTHEVYGSLDDLDLALCDGRWTPTDPGLAARGIDEQRPIQFDSPHGCSKGAADQYVLDYARSFGLQTVVFRLSCIYGPHQFGNEDQGWIAHFLLRALRGETISLYGDGRQVRDALYVEDLVEAMLLAHEHIEELSGRAFNIGGGPNHSISLLELTALIERIRGCPVAVDFADRRLDDPLYYVSNTNCFKSMTGWKPAVPLAQGIRRLHRWLAGQVTPAFLTQTSGAKPSAASRREAAALGSLNHRDPSITKAFATYE